MGFARLGALFGMVCILVGCGNLQGLKVAAPPAELQGRVVRLSSEALPKDSVTPAAFEVPGRSVYLKQTGGGSLAVGLLFGPIIGGAANAAAISRQTDEIAKSGQDSSFYQLNALQEAAAAWNEQLVDAKGMDGGAVSVKPYLILYVDNKKENLYTVAGFRADAVLPGDGKTDRKWNGHYNFAVDRIFSVAAMGSKLSEKDLAQYREAIRTGYKELRNELLADLAAGGRPPKRKVASINAPILPATLMGFASFIPGDVETGPGGKLVVRVNMDNYGPAMDKSTPYVVWVFPSASQYTFAAGPEDRQPSR